MGMASGKGWQGDALFATKLSSSYPWAMVSGPDILGINLSQTAGAGTLVSLF